MRDSHFNFGGNLNSGCSYLITAVNKYQSISSPHTFQKLKNISRQIPLFKKLLFNGGTGDDEQNKNSIFR